MAGCSRVGLSARVAKSWGARWKSEVKEGERKLESPCLWYNRDQGRRALGGLKFKFRQHQSINLVLRDGG